MFQLPSGSDKWAKKLVGRPHAEQTETPVSPFRTQFDFWYLLFLIGLGKGRRIAELTDSREITREYTESFHKHRHIIAAVVVSADVQLSRTPIEHNAIKQNVLNLLTTESPTLLSSDAIRMMNSFAHGGFEVIQSMYEGEPSNGSEFLLWAWKEVLSKSFSGHPWED